MARIKIKDGGDRDKVLDYIFPIVGIQDIADSTVAGYVIVNVSVPTIAEGDIVTCQALSSASVNSFITDVVVTAGTGFAVKMQDGSSGTLAYVVYHQNEA